MISDVFLFPKLKKKSLRSLFISEGIETGDLALSQDHMAGEGVTDKVAACAGALSIL